MRSIVRLVLERDAEPDPVAGHLPVLDGHVEVRMTSATRRSRIVFAAVSTAFLAAASHDSLLDTDHIGDPVDAVGHLAFSSRFR